VLIAFRQVLEFDALTRRQPIKLDLFPERQR
jgi:hypothetical protein